MEALDDDEGLDGYVTLAAALTAAIDLHGSRARRRHVATAMMRALAYHPTGETSVTTLSVFCTIAERLDELLANHLVAVEAQARALSSVLLNPELEAGFLDVDLGLVGETHQASEPWRRRVDLADALFPRLRRLLRQLAEEGLIVDLES